MRDPIHDLALAAEFPPARHEQWLKLVDGVLKGASFETLVSTSYDGIAIQPLYARAREATPVIGRPPGAPWEVMARIDHPDPAAANAEALHDLENGATALTLAFAGSVGAHGYGLRPGKDAIARVLEGVRLDAGIALDLDVSIPAREAPLQLAALIKEQDLDPGQIRLRAGLDPVRSLAVDGVSPLDDAALDALLVKLVKDLAGQGFRGPLVVADGRIIHNAGGSEAQELAYVLAANVAYLRALERGGLDLDMARSHLSFRLTADANQFLTTAKFRALRKLWARVEAACGLAPSPVFIAAETAWRMTTRRDPYVNLLRATIATFAAGIGGADAVAVLPFTQALGLPDRFARRMARNVQLILLEESNVARVGDPAAGSGGIEALTAGLCDAAWTLFQEIERAGGVYAALVSGLIQDKVAVIRTARAAALATGKEALTGTSAFPHLQEQPVEVLDVPAVTVPPLPVVAVTAKAMPPWRLAEPFEALRDASDAELARNGVRPRVFLANLGTPAEFAARASFAHNFFEAGGLEALNNDGFASHDEMAAAFRTSGAELACLCGNDAVYEREATGAARALREAGVVHLYLAGRPGAQRQALTDAGVQSYIHTGCDALAALQAAHAILKQAS